MRRYIAHFKKMLPYLQVWQASCNRSHLGVTGNCQEGAVRHPPGNFQHHAAALFRAQLQNPDAQLLLLLEGGWCSSSTRWRMRLV